MSDIADINGEEEKAPAIWGIVLEYVIAVVCFIGDDIGLYSLPDGSGWNFLDLLILYVGCGCFMSVGHKISLRIVPHQSVEGQLHKIGRVLLMLVGFASGMLSTLAVEYVWERLA